MQTTTITRNSKSQLPPTIPLRAIVEIIGGEVKIFPLADSDADEKRILEALEGYRQ